MGQQTRQRARRPEHKEERRRQILAAGRDLLERAELSEVTMEAVAKRAAIAKGTVFLYFPTKESLCLAVLGELLGEWFDDLDADFAVPGRFTSARLVRTVVSSVCARPVFVRLLSVLSSILERNVPLEHVVDFKTQLLARLATTGATLERRLGLRTGEGALLFLRMNALVVGLHHATDLAPVVREALALPELSPLAISFDAELPLLLTALLHGLTHHP